MLSIKLDLSLEILDVVELEETISPFSFHYFTS